MTTYVDTRIADVTTWDGLKAALKIHTATIKKLQATDPHQPADAQADAGHLLWNAHDITTSDARQLWTVLPHEEAAPDEPADDTHGNAVDHPTPDQ